VSRPRNVVPLGDNGDVMTCPACDRIARDERLLKEAVEEIRETRRYVLTAKEREAVEAEERMLAHLLDRIIERRAA
jgi:hypothetical protein